MGTIAFPTLAEDLLALFLFYCSLGQINQSEFTYRAYFYRTLGVPERRFFVLKSCARKVQVIMAHCGQVYQLSSSCFRSQHIEITILGLKIERQNTNQCLSGLRIKDQGVQRAQAFLVRSVFFLQPPRKHDDRSAFKKVLNSDRGFGAASRT